MLLAEWEDLGVAIGYLSVSGTLGWFLWQREIPYWLSQVFCGLAVIFTACGLHYVGDACGLHAWWLSSVTFGASIFLVASVNPWSVRQAISQAKKIETQSARLETLTRVIPISMATIDMGSSDGPVTWHTQKFLSQIAPEVQSAVGMLWNEEVFNGEIKPEWLEAQQRGARGELVVSDLDYWTARQKFISWIVAPVGDGEICIAFWDSTEAVKATAEYMDRQIADLTVEASESEPISD